MKKQLGPAAATLVAAALLLTGCGTSSGGGGPATSPSGVSTSTGAASSDGTATAGTTTAGTTTTAAADTINALTATGPAEARTVPDMKPIITNASPVLPATVKDSTGRTITVQHAERVIALDLYGTLTDTIIGLGLQDRLVGRGVSDTQQTLRHLPVVSKDGVDLNTEAVLSLKPDLVLTNMTIGSADDYRQLEAAGVTARGGFRGGRLIVVGIAVNAILTALDSWIVQRTDHDVASAASGWNAGSLNGVGMSDLVLPAVIAAVCVGVLVPLAGAIQQSTMGDDVAAATGVHLGRLRLVLLVVTVALTATVTAVAGPIAFVALCAPQIGRRLVGAPGVALWPAALTGAALLLFADIGAQWLLAPQSLPVGVMTTSFGGCYLLWFLIREVRSGRR